MVKNKITQLNIPLKNSKKRLLKKTFFIYKSIMSVVNHFAGTWLHKRTDCSYSVAKSTNRFRILSERELWFWGGRTIDLLIWDGYSWTTIRADSNSSVHNDLQSYSTIYQARHDLTLTPINFTPNWHLQYNTQTPRTKYTSFGLILFLYVYAVNNLAKHVEKK